MDARKKVYRGHSSIFKVSQQSLSKKKKIGCSVESVKKFHLKHITEALAATDGNGDQGNFLNFFQSLRLGDMVDAKQIPDKFGHVIKNKKTYPLRLKPPMEIF